MSATCVEPGCTRDAGHGPPWTGAEYHAWAPTDAELEAEDALLIGEAEERMARDSGNRTPLAEVWPWNAYARPPAIRCNWRDSEGNHCHLVQDHETEHFA